MFSKGTFQRYLHEIDDTQRQMGDLYADLVARTTDPAVHDELARLLEELEGETRTVNTIRNVLDGMN